MLRAARSISSAPWRDDRVRVAGIAPGDRADARRQFGQVEGLHEVVVGPGIQPFDPVRHLVERGQDDHGRHVAARAQGFEKADAAAVGQHQVEQDQIVSGAGHGIAGRIQPRDPVHRLAVACDLVAHGGAQNRVVLDQQDAHVGPVPFPMTLHDLSG